MKGIAANMDPLDRLGDRAGMPEYRAYAVGHDGHIFDSAALICKDDQEAIAQAKAAFVNCTIEVWSGARFVVRLERPDQPNRPR
ncbi:hypothetical protein JQ628_09135 [Bradyrhizobium lablabi]|uniref:hypothetical protein n=1 Tax=Bradyrhizobium lablabi TaxID=722472 RepID=UPI001BADC4F3|nr:hypothetical protein [Bradyrhizobium lablabi]MBR1121671.1 hypothetical protein [Bradyrhizobium lablabi]